MQTSVSSSCGLHGTQLSVRSPSMAALRTVSRQSNLQRRGSSVIECKESRIGKAPVTIPKGVKITLTGNNLIVKGPKGELTRSFPPLVEIKEIELEQGEVKVPALRVFKLEESRRANETHGLVRSLINGMVIGTSTGWTKTLTLIGVGYRAAAAGNKLTLTVGYSHPVEMEVPKGLTAKVEKNTSIIISGFDKELVGQFCATVRSKRPPEPYKGKGIRYSDEVIRKKEGKKGKK